jgi:hypothetical protein
MANLPKRAEILGLVLVGGHVKSTRVYSNTYALAGLLHQCGKAQVLSSSQC